MDTIRRISQISIANEAECCTCQWFKAASTKIFPCLEWLPFYSINDFKGDFIAGFTVGLTVVPQALALAQLADLPLQYGLYSAFMGSFMYAIFGTCKDLIIGPASVMAIMSEPYVQKGGPAYAVMLAFVSGVFQLIFGLFNLGCMVNFVSTAVLNGFTSAAAIIIIISQVKGLLGLDFTAANSFDAVYKTILHIPKANFYDAGMGVTCIIFLFIINYYKNAECLCISSPKLRSFVKLLWWSFATSRNAIVVLICSVIAAVLLSWHQQVFSLTQHLEAGLPDFQFPHFSVTYLDTETNITFTKHAVEIFQDLGTGIIVIPFLSLLEAIAIAKVFSKNKELNATKEVIALGMGNLMGAFVSSYPVTGSFSRSVINHASGVQTPLGGIISGILVLLALGFLAPSFHFIPKSCLSAVLLCAVIYMIHIQDIVNIWRTNKIEIIPYFSTVLCSLLWGLEFGLFFGLIFSLAILLYKQNQLQIDIKIVEVNSSLVTIHVTPEGCIYFPSIERFKGKITKSIDSVPPYPNKKVIIHGNRMVDIDYSAALGIRSIVHSLRKHQIITEFRITEPATLRALACLEDTITLCDSSMVIHGSINETIAETSELNVVSVNENQEPLLNKASYSSNIASKLSSNLSSKLSSKLSANLSK